MKKLFFCLLLISETRFVSAQTAPDSTIGNSKLATDSVFTFVEQMPQFPGGDVELLKYIGTNLKYPSRQEMETIVGKFFVRFVVEKDGSLSKLEFPRTPLPPPMEASVVKLIQEMPKWQPGQQDGKPVRVRMDLPVSCIKLE